MPDAAIRLPNLREALASMQDLLDETVAPAGAAPSLFGPASLSRRICREPAYAVSALAGLLYAALHPTAMAAIDQHSDYRRDAWRRAQRTTRYVFTITFGTRDAAVAAAARVRGIHARIAGTEPITSRPYRADDPDLLLWIHAANSEMALRGHEAFAAPLTAAQGDAFVAEQVAAAALVGLAPEVVPATRAALRETLAATPLLLSPPAREFFDLLVRASMPLTMRPFWALHLWGAAIVLPREVRRLYGFAEWIPTGRAARLFVAASLKPMDFAYGLFPRVRRARQRLAAAASGK